MGSKKERELTWCTSYIKDLKAKLFPVIFQSCSPLWIKYFNHKLQDFCSFDDVTSTATKALASKLFKMFLASYDYTIIFYGYLILECLKINKTNNSVIVGWRWYLLTGVFLQNSSWGSSNWCVSYEDDIFICLYYILYFFLQNSWCT